MNSVLSTNNPKKYLQISLAPFTKPRENQPFTPVDIVRSPKPKEVKKRGRKPKVAPSNPTQTAQLTVEVMDIEVPVADHKRGTYKISSHQTKLTLLTEYVEFRANPPLDENHKQISANEFLRRMSKKLSVPIDTLKCWCLKFEKDPGMLTRLQIRCSGMKSARESGHLYSRPVRLTYPVEMDIDLYDWITCALQMGMIITRKDIKDRARLFIQPVSPQFLGTDGWLEAFLERHDLSLRKNNGKPPIQLAELREISKKFTEAMKQIISKYDIKPEMIINMDESPFYWEYLPRKIVTHKTVDNTFAWKRGFEQVRSTVVLASTARGDLLRPSLILKRADPYYLRADNEINAQILHSSNGWMNEELMLLWIDQVLLPYVKKNHALLLMDSYEAHKSSRVLSHFQNYPNIHLGIIVGGTTSFSQPLDITVNKEFKAVCRRKSIEFTNRIIHSLNAIGSFSMPTINSNIVLINKQTVMAEKDMSRSKRQGSKQNLTQAMLIKRMTIEDVYGWLRDAYKYIESKPELIKKGFEKAGYISTQGEFNNSDDETVVSESDSDASSLISLNGSEIFEFEEESKEVKNSDFIKESYFDAYQEGNVEDYFNKFNYQKYIADYFEEASTFTKSNIEDGDTNMDLE